MLFHEAAQDYLAIRRNRVTPQTAKDQRWLLEHLKPVHDVPVAELDAPRLLQALRKIELVGSNATAHRACTLAGGVIRYALAAGIRTAPDPVPGLKTILVRPKTTNRAAITDPRRFGALLRSIRDDLTPSPVRDALMILPHVFVRPVELRGMRWSELRLEHGEWHIPAGRMKMRRPFVKFLSAPVVEMLREIDGRESSGVGDGYVFPGRDRGSISENIMGIALQRLFYSPQEHTPHGFRASASTMLHEAGCEHSVIEAALAHSRGDVYNRAEHVAAQKALHDRWSAMIQEMMAE
ncbi:MAG: site-specific integrase [Nocardiaceae bacterium]|nr:site-specific integrase [Nocardiaceae bacterium]